MNIDSSSNSVLTHLECPQCSKLDCSTPLRLYPEPCTLTCDSCGILIEGSDGQYSFGRMEQDSQSLLANQVDQFERKFRYNAALGDSILEDILALVNAGEYKLVADVGCGFGSTARILEGNYEAYYGFEPSDVSINDPVPSTIRNGDQSAMLIQYDPAKGIPIISDAVDLVLMIGSYDHIEDRRPVVEDICRILSHDGRMVFSMTNTGSWLKRLFISFGLSRLIPEDTEHYCRLNVDQVVDEIVSYSGGRLRLTKGRTKRLIVPNIPFLKRNIFQIPGLLTLAEGMLDVFFNKFLRIKDAGTYMVLEFAFRG